MQARMPPVLPDVRKIAVLRANSLGDFIFVLPALDAVRAAYPDAEITLLGREWHRAFLTGRPGAINRVLVISKEWDSVAGWRETPPDVIAASFVPLVRERFDLALQLHGGGRNSNPFIARLGARVTAGLRTPDAPPLDFWTPYVYYQPEVARYLEVVARIGAPAVTLEPRVAITEADRAEARQAMPETGAPLVALHPGAMDPRRRWPPAQFAAVGDALAAMGATVVVTGTPDEQDTIAAIVGAMRAPAQDLCGKLSLGGLAGLLARCRLVVANDTGPLHLALAVGAPAVGIYWCGNLITSGPLTRTRHRPMISWNVRCPVCSTDCTRASCNHHESFVADVTVNDVLDAARDLWESSSMYD